MTDLSVEHGVRLTSLSHGGGCGCKIAPGVLSEILRGGSGLPDRLPYLIMPVMTLALVSIGGYTRYVRAAMIEQLRQDYVRTARAKGAPDRRIVWHHALRNALIPVVTIGGASVMEVRMAGPMPLVFLPAGPLRLSVQGHALEEG